MKKHIQPYLIILLSLLTLAAAGQSNNKLEKALALVTEYVELSGPDKLVVPENISSFQALFTPGARVILDIPFASTESQNSEVKRISKDDRQQGELLSAYGKQVPVDLYIDLVNRYWKGTAAVDGTPAYTIEYTGRKDITLLERDTVTYEVRKRFTASDITLPDSGLYLVHIRFIDGKPLIYTIRVNDEKTNTLDLAFTFIDLAEKKSDRGYVLQGISADFRINNEYPVNNSVMLDQHADSSGRIMLPASAGRRSVLFIDTVRHPGNVRYDIPLEWKSGGVRATEQPGGGFVIGLRPYRWNGFTYTLNIYGGIFMPEEVDMTHFTEGSFSVEPGYKVGISFRVSYFFNHDRLKYNRKMWLFGAGSGLAFSYQQSEVSSDGFIQNNYEYIDYSNDNCEIGVRGNAFSEVNTMVGMTVPLYLELRKRTGNHFSFSMEGGVNLTFPLSTDFDASGNISRWGYYSDYGDKPIVDDEVLNYFTDSPNSYSGTIEYSRPQAEAFFSLNGFLHLFKRNPDNALRIGIEAALPFSAASNYWYPQGRRKNYEGYWINIEDNQYRSLAYATESIYSYYFGINIGINIIRYKPK
ncbi:MAG: hypothetical protein P8100_12185 [bacterium]